MGTILRSYKHKNHKSCQILHPGPLNTAASHVALLGGACGRHSQEPKEGRCSPLGPCRALRALSIVWESTHCSYRNRRRTTTTTTPHIFFFWHKQQVKIPMGWTWSPLPFYFSPLLNICPPCSLKLPLFKTDRRWVRPLLSPNKPSVRVSRDQELAVEED